ncbi:hypothetical protein OF83DRAFT_1179526, partial [Amylostereum chailletii]
MSGRPTDLTRVPNNRYASKDTMMHAYEELERNARQLSHSTLAEAAVILAPLARRRGGLHSQDRLAISTTPTPTAPSSPSASPSTATNSLSSFPSFSPPPSLSVSTSYSSVASDVPATPSWASPPPRSSTSTYSSSLGSRASGSFLDTPHDAPSPVPDFVLSNPFSFPFSPSRPRTPPQSFFPTYSGPESDAWGRFGALKRIERPEGAVPQPLAGGDAGTVGDSGASQASFDAQDYDSFGQDEDVNMDEDYSYADEEAMDEAEVDAQLQWQDEYGDEYDDAISVSTGSEVTGSATGDDDGVGFAIYHDERRLQDNYADDYEDAISVDSDDNMPPQTRSPSYVQAQDEEEDEGEGDENAFEGNENIFIDEDGKFSTLLGTPDFWEARSFPRIPLAVLSDDDADEHAFEVDANVYENENENEGASSPLGAPCFSRPFPRIPLGVLAEYNDAESDVIEIDSADEDEDEDEDEDMPMAGRIPVRVGPLTSSVPFQRREAISLNRRLPRTPFMYERGDAFMANVSDSESDASTGSSRPPSYKGRSPPQASPGLRRHYSLPIAPRLPQTPSAHPPRPSHSPLIEVSDSDSDFDLGPPSFSQPAPCTPLGPRRDHATLQRDLALSAEADRWATPPADEWRVHTLRRNVAPRRGLPPVARGQDDEIERFAFAPAPRTRRAARPRTPDPFEMTPPPS